MKEEGNQKFPSNFIITIRIYDFLCVIADFSLASGLRGKATVMDVPSGRFSRRSAVSQLIESLLGCPVALIPAFHLTSPVYRTLVRMVNN